MVWDLGFRASLFGLEVSPLGSHVLLFYVLSVGFPLGFEVSPFFSPRVHVRHRYTLA